MVHKWYIQYIHNDAQNVRIFTHYSVHVYIYMHIASGSYMMDPFWNIVWLYKQNSKLGAFCPKRQGSQDLP